jgi:quinoprotein dehydrogenase-associated probable ABC transporter substrate-binding protein
MMQFCTMRELAALLASAFLIALGGGAAAQQTSSKVDETALRVCADPGAMPDSNMKGEGFENKIAELIAADLGVPVKYEWFPQATGFIRNTLNANKCDVVIGVAQGDELVQSTNPYYKSAWVLITKADGDLANIKNLDDAALKGKSIGIQVGAPPATVMALNGLMKHSHSYGLMVDRRYESPPEEMLADLEKGDIDAAILWGPIGGYYAAKAKTPLKVIPLVAETKGPRMTFRISMGVRYRDQDWKRKLNKIIAKKQDDINKILRSYGVPLLDEQDKPLTQ